EVLDFFFFQAEDGIRDKLVTGVQTCALPISRLCTQAGRLDEAVEVLAGDIADGFTSFPRDVMRLTNLTGCAETIAMARHRPAAEIGRASCRERRESQGVLMARHMLRIGNVAA